MTIFKKKRFIPLFILALLIGIIGFTATSKASILGGSAGQMGLIGVVMALFLTVDGGCWLCDTYAVLFDTMNSLAGQVSSGMADDFLILLGVGVLFYIAFKVGGTVIKLQEVDLMQFLGDLFKHLGRAIIAAALLMGSVQMYTYIVSPFLAYSIALTNKIVVMDTHDGGSVWSYVTGKSSVTGLLSSSLNSTVAKSIPEVKSDLITANATDSHGNPLPFNTGLKEQLVGLIRYCSQSVIMGMILGATLILSGYLMAQKNVPHTQVMLLGFLIFGAHFAVFMAVPFKLVDVMIRLAFVAALTPVWIILWVFPPTVNYTKNAWEMLLNCCATLVCFAVIMVIVRQILGEMNPLTLEGLVSIGAEIASKYIGGGLSSMFGGKGEFSFIEKLSIVSPVVLKTMALGMLATGLVKTSSQIATQIVKSYGTGVGDHMDKQMAQSMSTMGGLGGLLGGMGAAAYGGDMKNLMQMINGVKPTQSTSPSPQPSPTPQTSPSPPPSPTPTPTKKP